MKNVDKMYIGLKTHVCSYIISYCCLILPRHIFYVKTTNNKKDFITYER